MQALPDPIVFLVDVDNTLIDAEQIDRDIMGHVLRAYGAPFSERYRAIADQLHDQLGYCDYLGALQRHRERFPEDIRLLAMSSFIVDYPFANRLYPGALDVLERFQEWGQTVVLSDGDVVFQPRKIERSGILESVQGHVLVYAHKDRSFLDVERRYPAAHYVMVDDQPRILSVAKQHWRDLVTTVLPRRGRQTREVHPRSTAGAPADAPADACPRADVIVPRIGALLEWDLRSLLAHGFGKPAQS